jgi:predicted transcriptional regulator
MYKSYDDLPLMLSVHDVAEVLGISKSSAYVLAKEKGFPTLKIRESSGSEREIYRMDQQKHFKVKGE